MKRKITLCALALLLTGCIHTAPRVQDQPLPEDRLLTKWKALTSRSKGAPGTLTLDGAIQEALEAAPELEQVRQRVRAAEEVVRQAESFFYPRLVASEAFNRTDNPVYALMNIINQRRLEPTVDFNHPGPQQNFSTQIKGEWSLFEGGSRFYNRRAALYRQDATEAELLSARNQLVAKVTETYYRWLQALGFIGAAERAFEAARTDQRLGEARVHAEVALQSDLLRLRASTAEMKGNLLTARTSAKRLQAAMERLMARPIGQGEVPEPALVEPPPQERPDPDTLVRTAMERRPEMAAVRSLIHAARMSVRSARGGLLPSLGTSAGYQWDSEDLNGAAESWMVAVTATWPLFQGGITLSRIREARVHVKELEAKGEQVALDIALEVEQAALAVEEASEKVRVAAERKNYAGEALEQIRNQYRQEVVTVDALLQAQVAWNQAEVSHTAALFDAKIAQALLRQSLGDFADWMETRNGQ